MNLIVTRVTEIAFGIVTFACMYSWLLTQKLSNTKNY